MATPEDQLKSEAYLIYSEFGPKLRIPRPERLATEFPQLPKATRDEWISEFKEVNRAVWKSAKEDAPGEVEKKFADLFSWMSAEALQRAHRLAAYYAMHEGYDRV